MDLYFKQTVFLTAYISCVSQLNSVIVLCNHVMFACSLCDLGTDFECHVFNISVLSQAEVSLCWSQCAQHIFSCIFSTGTAIEIEL